MAVLSKVKHKAKKLKDKLKKVRGSSKTSADHEGHDARDSPIFDEGAESDEDDEEEVKPNQNEFKYEQLRSIGALDSPGDGSEVEVHGGVPVPAAADNRGTYWNKSDDSDPIGPYKSAGPPDALQATPTKYRNYAADDVSPEKGISADRKLEVESPPAEYGRIGKEGASSLVPEVKASSRSYDEQAEPHSKWDVSGVPAVSTDEPPSENLVEHNPSFGKLSTPIYDNIAVADEDLSADRKLGVGLPPGEHVGSGTGNTSVPEYNPDEEASFLSDAEHARPTSKLDATNVPASYTDESFSENLAERNPSFGKLSTPIYDNIAVANEDLTADRKLGVGLSPDEHVESVKGIPLDTSAPEYKPEERSALFSDAQQAEPTSSYGISDSASASASASASDMDVSYPGDIVKPNPSFGKSSSPTHEKIAVMNEDASPDGMRGFGLSTEDHSGSEKGNLLDTSVPEFEELSGYRKGSSSGPLEADELVYKPLSEPEPEVGSSLASPPGKLGEVAGQRFGTEQGPDYKASQTQDTSQRDLDLPTSVVDKADLKGEDDLPTSYPEQRPKFDEATKQAADSGIDTSGGDDRENWGKWSADKINKAKDVTVSGLVGTDYRPDSESRGYDPVDVVGSAVEVPDSQNVDAAKRDAIEGEGKDAEEEYYDPNEVKDNQFEEGFALGSEDALSGTLAGSAIDKLQGLKETVQSSLGYSTPENRGVGGEDKSSLEGEGGPLSPSSYRQQTSGVGQGLREGVASSLEYDRAVADGTEHRKDDLEGGLGSEADRDSRQQQPGFEAEENAPSPSSYKQPTGGFIQGLKQTFASSLGYGKAASEKADDKSDTLERGGELEGEFDSSQHQPVVEGAERTSLPSSNEQELGENVQGPTEVVTSFPRSGKAASDEAGHDDYVGGRGGGSEAGADTMHHQPVLEGEEKALSPNSYKQQTGGFVQGLRQAVASSLGYGKVASDEAGHENDVLERGGGSEADFDSSQHQPGPEGKDRVLSPSSYEQQTVGDVQEPKEVVAAPLGPKEAVESPLGYGEGASDEAGHNNDVLERGGVTVDGDDTRQYSPVLEGEEAALSPSSHKEQQTGGFVQGLKNTVASSLGYGKGTFEGSGHEKDVPERAGGSEADLDSKHQQPGTYQAIKNVVASKLGYGSAENSPVITKQSESREFPVEQVSHEPKFGYGSAEQSPVIAKESEAREFPAEQVPYEPLYNQGGEQQHDTEGGYAQSEFRNDINRENEVSELPGSGGVLQGVKDQAIATPGYNSQPEDTSTDATHMEPVPSPSSYSQKLMDTTAAARNYLSSKIGYGGSSKERGETGFDHGYAGEKGLSPSTHVDNTVNEQSSVTSKLHPSDEDKALSDLITEKMSSTANTIGGKVGSGLEEEEKTLSPRSFKQQTGAVSFLEYGKTAADETEHNKNGMEGSGGLEADLYSKKQQSALEGEESAVSHGSYKQQAGGFAEGLKNIVASSLGYGIAASEEGDHEIDGMERSGGSEADLDSKKQQSEAYQALQNVGAPKLGYDSAEKSPAIAEENEFCKIPVEDAPQEMLYSEGRHQQNDTGGGNVLSAARDNAGDGGSDVDLDSTLQRPGTYQALKNVVASKLGYGPAEKSPVLTKDKESQEFPLEEVSQEQLYNEGGQQQHGTEGESKLSDVRDDANGENEVSELPGSGEVLQDVEGQVVSMPGYSSQPEDTSSDAILIESVSSPSSYTQKIMDTTAAARKYLSSEVGHGSSSKEKGEKDLGQGDEGERGLNPSIHVNSTENEQSNVVPKLHPSDDEQAPLDLITEKVSSTASIIGGEDGFGPEGDERALSPSSHEHMEGFVQALSKPTTSSPGHGKAISNETEHNNDGLDGGDKSEADHDAREQQSSLEGEESALSPSIYKPQKSGFVQGLKQMVASSLGYGKRASDEAGYENDGLQRDGEPEADFDSSPHQPGFKGEDGDFSPSSYGQQTEGVVDRVFSPSNDEQQTGGVVEGLKDTDAPSLGNRKAASDEPGHDIVSEKGDELEGDVDSRQHPPVLEREERALSPSSNKQQQPGGFVQGLKNTVASSLGYSKATSEEAGYEKDALERGSGSEADLDIEHQQPGTYQTLKNVAASKLGYGPAEKSPVITNKKESREFPLEEISQEQLHDEGGEQQHDSEKELIDDRDDASRENEVSKLPGSGEVLQDVQEHLLNEGGEQQHDSERELIDARDDTNRENEVSKLPGSGEVLQDNGQVITSSGSNSKPEETSTDVTHIESVSSPSSYTQKLMNTTAAARNYLSSKVGYGSSSKEKGEKELVHGLEGEKGFSPSIHVGNTENEQSSIVSKLHPSDDYKAPSDLITESVSSTASRKGMENGSGLEGEERALSPSNYKQQTDGFVQSLREPVASSPGKAGCDETERDRDGLGEGDGSEANLAASRQPAGPEGEESAPSPSSYKPQTGGFVQGLKQTVASSLGYGKKASDASGYKIDGLQRGGESEADSDSKSYQPGSEGEDGVLSPSSYEQQMVGSGLGLKEAVASPLGYDEAASDAAAGHNIDVLGRGGGSEADISIRQYQPVLEGEEKAYSPSSYEQRTGGFLQGLKQTFASSLGYGNVTSDEAGHKNDGLERGGDPETDFDSSQYQSAPKGEDRISPSSYEQQAGGDVQGPKEADASPLGLKETVASPLGYSIAAETGGDDQGLKEVGGSSLGLKEAVTSPLGYSKAASDEAALNNDVSKRGVGAEADVDTRQYQPALSPNSYNQQTVASSLGYGKAASKEAGHENEGFGRGVGSEADLDSKQQQPGTYQALKNAVASKLGYGSAERAPVIIKENEPQESPVEISQEQLYNEGGEEQHNTEGGHMQSIARDVPQEQLYNEGGEQQHDTEEGPEEGQVLSDATDNAQDGGSEAVLDSKQQQRGTYQALKNVVASKLGYGPADQSPVITEEKESCEFPVKEESHAQLYNEGGEQQRDTEGGYVQNDVKDEANRENEYNSQPEDTPSYATHIESVPSPSSYTQKLMHTTAAARSFLSSKVGFGSSNKERQERGFDHGQEGEKSLSPSAHVDNTKYEQSSIASKLHPTDEDKALADLITEKVASTASMMGEKLRLFGSPRRPDMPASYQPQH